MESSKIHSLAEEPLEDLLLCLEAREDSVKLSVKTPVGDAQIHVDRGRLGVAVFGAQLGVEAFKSLLSYRDGTYTILRVPPEECDLREHAQLGAIIREKERNSTRLAASGSRPPLRVAASLSRTSEKLPSGLTPTELRSLAAIDGRTTVLNMVRRSKDLPEDALAALRELIRRGLAVEVKAISVSPTLSMGSGDKTSSSPPPRTDRSNQFARSESSSPPAQRHVSPLPPFREGGEREVSSERAQLGRKSTGRWAKGPHKRPALDYTGYSSVPPPALAAEHVERPR